MSNPTTIVTLADAKAHLNIETIDDDTELQNFIEAATPVIEKIAGPVIVQTVTEYFDGGRPTLTLSKLPVISVTSVTETIGDTNYVLTAVTLGSSTTPTGYTLDPERGRITRRVYNATGEFVDGLGNVKVVYSAGRANIPKNIRLAALELISHWWSMSQRNRNGGRPAFGGEDVLNMGAGYAIPNRVRELLQPDPPIPGVA